MSMSSRAANGGWQAWLRSVAHAAPRDARVIVSHGARVADPMRHAWRAHLAWVAATRA